MSLNRSTPGSIAAIKRTNEEILAALDLPNYLLHNQSIIDQERVKIDTLSDTTERCHSICAVTIGTIDNFTAQVTTLEALLTPMQNETKSIIQARQNINEALREAHQIVDNLDIVQKYEQFISASSSSSAAVSAALYNSVDLGKSTKGAITAAAAATTTTTSAITSAQLPAQKPANELTSSDANNDYLHSDYYEFLQILLQLQQSFKFWQFRSSFKGADRIQRRIRDIIQTALNACASEFDKNLQFASKTIDISRHGWPLPPKVEWVNAPVLDRLSVLAQGMCTNIDATWSKANIASGGHLNSNESSQQTSTKILQLLTQHRKPFLKSTYKQLVQRDRSNSLWNIGASLFGHEKNEKQHGDNTTGTSSDPKKKSAKKKNDSQTPHFRGDDTTTAQMAASNLLRGYKPGSLAATQGASGIAVDAQINISRDALGRYAAGDHPIIFYSNVLLGILQLEWKTWQVILAQCEGLEPDAIETAFSQATHSTVQVFSKVINAFLETTSNNKLLYTLDVLGHLQQLQPAFRQVLKKGLDEVDSYALVMELKNQITNAVQTTLLEHIINSVKVSQSDKRSPRMDGNVSDVTVETVTFLRALCTYDNVLDALPVEIAYTATTKPFLTTQQNKKPLTLSAVQDLNNRLQMEMEAQAEQQANIRGGAKLPAIIAATALNRNVDVSSAATNTTTVVTATGKDSSQKTSAQSEREKEANISLERFLKNKAQKNGPVWKTVLPLSILPGLDDTHGICTVSQGVVWTILQGLDATLQVRSQHLAKRPELLWLFYLNNYHYIAQAASKQFFRVHQLFLTFYINKTQRAKIMYQTNSFSKLLDYLDTENYDVKLEQPDKRGNTQRAYWRLVKNKFTGFNNTFSNLYRTQRAYSVPDSDLRGQLRSESVDIVAPLYNRFLEKYGSISYGNKSITKYIYYRSDVLEQLLNKFFDELA